ncbi:MAG: HD domain-containing protein [Gemmatimonadaceae bacterium]
MSAAELIELPPWAEVSGPRRDHIERVTTLLLTWARELRLKTEITEIWRDAGLWHDALRNADEQTLRTLSLDTVRPAELLHGPAVANKLEREGEHRLELLDAIRWHTVGHSGWGRTGRALYMADFLDPGRKVSREERAFLAEQVVHDFDGVFRQVVRQRIEWAVREGHRIYPETVELWNSVR